MTSIYGPGNGDVGGTASNSNSTSKSAGGDKYGPGDGTGTRASAAGSGSGSASASPSATARASASTSASASATAEEQEISAVYTQYVKDVCAMLVAYGPLTSKGATGNHQSLLISRLLHTLSHRVLYTPSNHVSCVPYIYSYCCLIH